jgi:RNA polymerase sigma-70 factor, ECF subfamily
MRVNSQEGRVEDLNVDKATGSGRKALADEEIVRRILAGDGSLFELIMRRYNQRLFRIVRALLGNDAEAEEVVQQAYVNAYTHLDQFAGQASFATWLTRIAVHEAYANTRRRKRTTAFPRPVESGQAGLDEGDTMPSSTPDPEHQAATAEVRRLLETAIDSLRPTYRSVFVLREVEGLSTQETAESLGISEEAVKVRFHRSKALLRKELFDRAGLVAPNAFPFLGARCDRMVRAVLARLGLPEPPEAA